MAGINPEDSMHMEFIDMENVRSFKGRDVLRIGDFNRDEITYVLEVARVMGDDFLRNRDDLRNFTFKDLLKGKVIGTNFSEDSSRTHDSHCFAASNLGATVVPIRRNASGTSKAKGESLAHDFATLATYGIHAIVMRQSLEGSPQAIADYLTELSKAHPDAVTDARIINGGDGSHEHPTQAFLDLALLYNLYNVNFDGTAKKKYGEQTREDVLSGLTMLAVGDTLKGRTFKSLARALAQFEDNEVLIVSPEEVRSPEAEIQDFKQRGLKVQVFNALDEGMEYINKRHRKSFIYGLRTQEERLDPKVFEKVKGLVNITPELIDLYEGTGILPIMHPLPMHRMHPEISPEIDFREEALYFKQMAMGQFARMALFSLVLGRVRTSADARKYVDNRIKGDVERFVKLDLNRWMDDEVKIINSLQNLAASDAGVAKLKRALLAMSSAAEDGEGKMLTRLYMDLFSDLTDDGKLLELVHHLTFRFQKGESGFVIDHIENGKTGLMKYHLSLSSWGKETDAKGNPVLISAVDGLLGKSGGIKGVIKVRGHDLPLAETAQYCYHLSKTPIVITKIEDGLPVSKWTPTRPYELRGFIHCPNPLCVSNPKHSQHVISVFYHMGGDDYKCRYCDTAVAREDFRIIKSG
ncbi:hypothetical protein ACFL3V_05590 [Nanoarchaeota archaeon]